MNSLGHSADDYIFEFMVKFWVNGEVNNMINWYLTSITTPLEYISKNVIFWIVSLWSYFTVIIPVSGNINIVETSMFFFENFFVNVTFCGKQTESN